jgi:hypothetical protein
VSAKLFRNSLVALILGAAACSAGGGKKIDSGTADVVLDFLFGDLPPGCPPGAGNDKNVGGFCTRQGGQCGSMYCTCDDLVGVQPPVDTPCFCTLVRFATCENLATSEPGFCGQNATCCGYMNQGSLCVPNACLAEMMCPVFAP